MTSALLIGYGSIGRHHAAVLQEAVTNLWIVDPSEAARERARAAHPAARILDRFEALDGEPLDWKSILAVIASWGPSHAETFHALVDRGVRHILCEKPLATSIQLADGMVARAEQEGVGFGVHHYVRCAGFAPALRQFAATHDLGEPVSVEVIGGASCLVTNGIHWIDFASDMLGGPPQSVISTASGQPINPRSPTLAFYGGTAVWSFGGGREAVISLNNGSSVALRVQVFYRDAVAECDADLNLVVRRRDRAAVAEFPKITRTGPLVEPLFEGRLPGVASIKEGMRLLVDEVSSGRVTLSPGRFGAASVNACIGALVAGRDGRSVSLPISADSDWGRETWPIS